MDWKKKSGVEEERRVEGPPESDGLRVCRDWVGSKLDDPDRPPEFECTEGYRGRDWGSRILGSGVGI